MLVNPNFYTVLVLCTIFAYTQQQLKDPAFMAKYGGFREECTKEIGLDINFVKKIWSENHFPNDNKLKCYFKCMTLKLGVINQAGDVIDDILKTVQAQFVDAATDTEIVQECGAIQGADLCETAFKLMACVKNATLD